MAKEYYAQGQSDSTSAGLDIASAYGAFGGAAGAAGGAAGAAGGAGAGAAAGAGAGAAGAGGGGAAAIWWAVIQQIIGHLSRGAAGWMQYKVGREQEKAAQKMIDMTDKLGMVEFAMERQRQMMGREAMEDQLAQIDEAYGMAETPRAMRNRAIIKGMISQLGRGAARPAAEGALAAGAGEALRVRRVNAARGVGGSVASQMAREVAGLSAARREGVAARREEAEYDVEAGLRERRMQARRAATSLADVSGARIHSPYEDVMLNIATQSAKEQEKYRHGRKLALNIGQSILNLMGSGVKAAGAYEKGYQEKLLENARENQIALEDPDYM